MSLEHQTTLTVVVAQEILSKFNCLEVAPSVTSEEKALIREALLLLVSLSDYQILGICADTTAEALLALTTYSQALGYEPDTNLKAVEGSVYIKFNGKNGLCYIDSYTGNHRGVLVSCQSYYDGGLNAMYGHLPLDLFVS
jgi:hypothetical protein